MNYRIDNLQYCKWSREVFEINREAGLDAVHVTVVYHEDFDEFLERTKEWDEHFKNNSELEKYICKFSDRTNYENKINENFNLIQILGDTFQGKKFNPIINQNTGFNLSTLKAKKGKLENLKFLKPTIMFSQKGSWQIKIDDFLMKLNPRDTISIPINSQVNIEINDDEESLLNCVTQI
jgi:hypothetical protein